MRTCANCGEENPDRARFCLGCGTELAVAGPREERKQVTVLFADIVGFTTRSDRADPEDVKATLLPFHARAKHIVENFGGIVDKFIGDAVMAVFGSPEAHEDDPERAVLSALAMLAAIPEINAAHAGLDLSIRIGVNTGEAVVAFGRGPQIGEAVAGDVVNTASRLQGVAKPGEIVVGEPTYRATRDAIEYLELEPVRVKGKADALGVWKARRALPRAERRPYRGAFVGREAELRLLIDAHERSAKTGTAGLVLVTGEPGVGKSRLVLEFRERVCTGTETAWRRGRCVAYGTAASLAALEEIVRAEAGLAEGDDDAAIEAKLDASVGAADETERAWLVARVGPIVGLARDDRPEREESFAAWRRYLELRAATRSLVVEIEDLHWADDVMLGFLGHLAIAPPHAPLFIVCTSRPQIAEHPSALDTSATLIPLHPLEAGPTADLVRTLAAASGIDIGEVALNRLIERSAGNALFAEEFVRLMAEGDGSADVPSSVQALIATRIDGLPPKTKLFLRDASVVGASFWPGLLDAMDHHDTPARLSELEGRELVRPSAPSSIDGEVEYRFWHALIRDVAYAQISRGDRSEKHRVAAEWLERRAPNAAELIAHHATEALSLGRAAGRETAELAASAVRALTAAGDRAMALDAERAEMFLALALELLPPGAPERADVRWKVLVAGRRSGTLTGEEGERAYKECIEAFRARGDAEALGEAMVRFGTFLATRGRVTEGRRVQDEGIALLEGRPPSRALATAYVTRAEERMYDGLVEEALDWARKAIDVASDPSLPRQRIAEQLSYALVVRAHVRLELGNLDGIEDFRRARALAIEGGESMAAGVTHSAIGEWTWLIDGPAAGLAVYDDVIAFSRSRGLGTHIHWARAESVQLLYDAGRWDEALRAGDETVEWERDKGLAYLSVIARSYRALIEVRRGATEKGETEAPEFLAAGREVGDLQILVPALVAAAVVEHAAGRSPVPLLDELETATHDRAPEYRLVHLVETVGLALAAGDAGLAERLLDVRPLPMARAGVAIVTARALVAEAHGRNDEALGLFDKAVKIWASLGVPLEHSRALLGMARCLGANGLKDDAVTARAEATKIRAGLRVPGPA